MTPAPKSLRERIDEVLAIKARMEVILERGRKTTEPFIGSALKGYNIENEKLLQKASLEMPELIQELLTRLKKMEEYAYRVAHSPEWVPLAFRIDASNLLNEISLEK